jgi:hypothetical protein
LAITGRSERVFIANPIQGVLALVAMQAPVAAALLSVFNNPFRITSVEADPNPDFFITPGYTEDGTADEVGGMPEFGKGLVGAFSSALILLGIAVHRYRRQSKEVVAETPEPTLEITISADRIREGIHPVAEMSPAKHARRRGSVSLAPVPFTNNYQDV